MRRRQFVFTATTLALLGGCGVLPNLGKPSTPGVPRVGILDPWAADDPGSNAQIAGLKQGLAELGYVDGQDIIFEPRDSDGKVDPLRALANELIQLPVEVIVALSTPATQAARQATSVIPIVFVNVTDPVGQGIVASLAHPGGNLTGAASPPTTTFQKELEILGQLVPGMARVAIVLDASNPAMILRSRAVAPTANTMGVQLKTLDMRSADDVEPALAEALAWQAEAVMNLSGPATAVAMPRFLDFQLQNRIPLAVNSEQEVQAGGLLFYGVSNNVKGRTAAALVDKIIKGTKPADLPVEQPTAYELVINQTTAQALGITIPPEVAQQVTQWVQ
jgi:ABC-type uncharacterized transport system substrate-binding protein